MHWPQRKPSQASIESKVAIQNTFTKKPQKINLVKVQNGINGIFFFFHAVLWYLIGYQLKILSTIIS